MVHFIHGTWEGMLAYIMLTLWLILLHSLDLFRSNYVLPFLNSNNFFQRFLSTFQQQRQFHKESYIHTISASPKVGTCAFLVSFLYSLVTSINQHFPHSTNERWKTKKRVWLITPGDSWPLQSITTTTWAAVGTSKCWLSRTLNAV